MSAARGLVLGRRPDRTLVTSRPSCHVVAFGPSQTGKTASLAAHVVRRVAVTGADHTVGVAAGAMVTSSTKTDLLRLPRSGAGRHLLLDLVADAVRTEEVPDGVQLTGFSPLSLVGDAESSLLVGRTLMDTASSVSGTGVRQEGYWTHGGARLLSSVLLACARVGAGLSLAQQWLAARSAAAPLACLQESDHFARAVLQGYLNDEQSGETTSAMWSFADLALSLYAYPTAVARAEDAAFDVQAFVRSQDTLHVVCPGRWARELGPVIAVLLQAIADARYRLHVLEPDHPALTMVLDEVANTSPLPGLPGLCSEGAGQGVRLWLGAQDRAQLEQRWGSGDARTIVSNCRDRILLPELGDRPLLEDVEALCGIRREEETSATDTQGAERSSTTTRSLRDVPLWRAFEVAQLEAFHALYLRGWSPEVLRLVRGTDL